MARKKVIKDVDTALRIYYTYPELGTEQIQELFDVSVSTATRWKKDVKKEQKANGIKTMSICTVNTRLAYKMWCIDIKTLKECHEGMKTLRGEGVKG